MNEYSSAQIATVWWWPPSNPWPLTWHWPLTFVLAKPGIKDTNFITRSLTFQSHRAFKGTSSSSPGRPRSFGLSSSEDVVSVRERSKRIPWCHSDDHCGGGGRPVVSSRSELDYNVLFNLGREFNFRVRDSNRIKTQMTRENKTLYRRLAGHSKFIDRWTRSFKF